MERLKAERNSAYTAFQKQVKALSDGMARQSADVRSEFEALQLNMLGQSQSKLSAFKGRAVLLQIASLSDEVHLFVTGTETQTHRTSAVSRAKLARLAFEGWSAAARADLRLMTSSRHCTSAH